MKGLIKNINKDQAGVSLIETLVAFGILSVVAVAFLSGLTTSLTGTFTAKEQAVAESLARSQLDYVKSTGYGSTYPVSPYLVLPEGWSVPAPVVEPAHVIDDGLQKITVTPEHNGSPILSMTTYKMNR